MTDTNEGNVCRGCYDYCFKCSSRQHPKGMAAHEICNSCAENMARCEACGDYLDEYDTVSCVECRVPYCNWCSDEPENMTRTEDDEPICRDCAPVKSAETFEARSYSKKGKGFLSRFGRKMPRKQPVVADPRSQAGQKQQQQMVAKDDDGKYLNLGAEAGYSPYNYSPDLSTCVSDKMTRPGSVL